MKNSYKISMIVTLLFLLGSVINVSAKEKERFLPTSTKSDAAKAAYAKGIDRLTNADIDPYIQAMKEALQADPNFFMAQTHLALMGVMDRKESNSEANIELEKALKIPQDNLTEAEKIVRKLLVKIQEDPKADLTPITDELVKAYPDTREAWGLSRAVAVNIEGDQESGYRYAQKLVDLAPEFGPAHNFLGYAYMDKGEMDKAKKEFEEYLRLSPNEANAHDSMGEFYMNTGDYAKSAEHYNKAVAMGMEVSKKNAEKATALANGEDPAKFNKEKTAQEKDDDSQR